MAEEFAMLDLHQRRPAHRRLPGRQQPGRNFGYGMNPATLRDRYYEAERLIVEAWTNPEVFAFNGKYNQLRYVNIWPRPLQQPHPPIWIPGGGSIETWGWCLEKSYLYAYLSYCGFKRGKMVMDGFWQQGRRARASNRTRTTPDSSSWSPSANPKSQVEEQFGPHGEYFYNKMLHVYPGFREAPGYRTLDTIRMGLLGQTTSFGDRPPSLTLEGSAGPGQHHRRHAQPGDRAARARRSRACTSAT